jgi:SET and MYND domain-containing protein 4
MSRKPAMNLKKSTLKANEHRLAGNEAYKSCKFREALVSYNKSLCHAIPGSREFSLAFANRSAVYFELDEFELSLENIQLAVDCGGYPEDKLQVLMARREKCFDALQVDERGNQKNPRNFFKLSGANEKIPFVIDAVEMRETKRFGRHLITNRALKTGEVICMEKPLYKLIMNNARFSHCGNCLKSDMLNLFPCCECNYGEFASRWGHCGKS